MICPMLQEGKGTDEAIENRNYLAKRMTDEISEVILFHFPRSMNLVIISFAGNANLGGVGSDGQFGQDCQRDEWTEPD